MLAPKKSSLPSSSTAYKEDDLFKSNAFLDTYGKVYAQMKKNLDVQLENAANLDNLTDESSDFTCLDDDSAPIFDDASNTFSVFVNPEQSSFRLPTDILHLSSLTNFFDLNILQDTLDPEQMKKLRSLLPASQTEAEQNDTMKRLFAGEAFSFGQNPLDRFLSLAKDGTFTAMRYQEKQIESKLAKNAYLTYYEEALQIAKSKLSPQNVQRIKNLLGKRRAQKRLEELMKQSSESEKSDISFADIQAAVDFDQASAGYTTDGSQEERELYRRKNNQTAGQSQNPLTMNANTNGGRTFQNDESNISDNYSDGGQQNAQRLYASNLGDHMPYNKTKKSKVPVSKEWLENYREQERQRYENPTKPWVFICQNGVKTCIAPVCKKLNVSLQSRPRDHAFLKQNRSPYITILSLVRDACSRMVGGKGTRFDICELLKESQYINSDLRYEKVSTIVSGALDRLHYLEDPCIKYDQEKKVWFYLHGDRDEDHPAWKEDVYDNPMNF